MRKAALARMKVADRAEMSCHEQVLSNAMDIRSNREFVELGADVVVAVGAMAPEQPCILSFCPSDRCFNVAIDGKERLRTDSPQIACAYFIARQRYR